MRRSDSRGAVAVFGQEADVARVFRNDFDAVAAFKTLHGDGTTEAVRTAGLLCTDLRWRRCSTTLIGRVEASGILERD